MSKSLILPSNLIVVAADAEVCHKTTVCRTDALTYSRRAPSEWFHPTQGGIVLEAEYREHAAGNLSGISCTS